MVTHSSGESHGQRSLVGAKDHPWSRKQLDMIEGLSTHTQCVETYTFVKYFKK